MNNEETIIMQPQNNNQAQQTQKVETPKQENKTEEVKNESKGNTAKRVAATAAMGVAGAAGGVGAYAATSMLNEEEVEVVAEETPATAEAPHAQPTETKEEEIPVTLDEEGNPDYTGQAGANPVVNEPEPQPTGNEPEPEVEILGVYENEEGQEAILLTDGETNAIVYDANGDGEANLVGIDENHNGHLEDGEIYDVSDQHISMQPIEEEYLAQQQMEMEQQDTFAINADDTTDYNNDAPDLTFA